jgi:Tol biopolymer transport system component
MGNESAPAWSQDGRWIAFQGDQAGNWDIYFIEVVAPANQSTRLPARSGEVNLLWFSDGMSADEEHPAWIVVP